MLDIISKKTEKKTKIMIFQERAKKNYDVEFHIGNHTNDVVHEYTYLLNW